MKRMSDRETVSQSATGFIPLLRFPSPSTAIGRVIAPLFRASLLRDVQSIIDQQNQINQLIAAELDLLSDQTNTKLSDQIKARLAMMEAQQSDVPAAFAGDQIDSPKS